jgi:hypothetical protein
MFKIRRPAKSYILKTNGALLLSLPSQGESKPNHKKTHRQEGGCTLRRIIGRENEVMDQGCKTFY